MEYKAVIVETREIFCESGLLQMKQTIEERFEAKDDEEGFRKACGMIYERTFRRSISLRCNLIQKLEMIMEDSRVVDCSGYQLRSGLQRDQKGKVYAMKMVL